MLLELVVENYAVVERLRVNFHAGLNLLTGETGSGKSIVVDALGLLLGGRAQADMIRTGEARARVAGLFDVREQAAIRRLLEPSGLEAEDGELLVEREILASGKSRAFVGSRPVSVSLLKDLAPFLADIHGQHDQQLLFSPDAQREMLDAFGGHRDAVERIDSLFGQWRAGAAELEELERSEQEKLRLLDLWSFQRKEIESAQLEPDEETALENERRVLNNVQRLEEAATAAYTAIYDGPDSARSQVRLAAKRIEELARIDGTLDPLREHLKAADLSLQEVSYTLRDYLGRLEANPGRIEEVELRLAAIDKLKRKYGAIGARHSELPGRRTAANRTGRDRGRAHDGLAQAAGKPGRGLSDDRRVSLPRGATRRLANWRSRWKRNSRNSRWSVRCFGCRSLRRCGRRTAPIGWSFWCRRMWAKSRADSRRWRRAASCRASRWR